MTDRETLFIYRLRQADTTLADAEKMLAQGVSPRSVVNRAYYAMFYMVLALFLKTGKSLRTSRHSGVIGAFDTQFVQTGQLDREYSRMLHSMFDDRQEFDYREFADVSQEDARRGVDCARQFVERLKLYVA